MSAALLALLAFVLGTLVGALAVVLVLAWRQLSKLELRQVDTEPAPIR